jgi:hypothetical protein
MSVGQIILLVIAGGTLVELGFRVTREKPTWRFLFAVFWVIGIASAIITLLYRFVGGKEWDKPAPTWKGEKKRAKEVGACPHCQGKVMTFEEVCARADLVLKGVEERRARAAKGETQVTMGELLDEDVECCARVTLHFMREHGKPPA